jgi:phosphoenolpyruvate synthase/pyruvate phosphate dikinase
LANADTPEDAITARKNGAQGIGLCRTEHMVQKYSIQLFVIAN